MTAISARQAVVRRGINLSYVTISSTTAWKQSGLWWQGCYRAA